jgi:WD40 repeat protein
MRVRRLCSFIVSLLVVASIIFVPAAKSQSAFQYFYAVATPSEIQLWAVSSQQPQQVQTLAIPNVIYANASPNGEWIAFISATDNLGPQSVSVWNIRSRELIEVSRGEVYYSSMLNEYSLRWSPNSQYLAIAANGELLIYNSISSTTATIGRGGNLLHIAWSPDSLSVAAAGWQYTGTGQGANASIQVIEMTTNNLSISYDLTQEQFLYNAPVCDLAWSPGGQFISFRSFCDVADVASPREVYVWDIRVNSIQTVTRGTIEAFLLTPGSIIRGEYDHVWQGENRLIVGLDIYTERDGQVSQTLFYDPIRQTIDVLSPRAFMKLAVNPVSGTLAFQASDHLH